MIIVVVVVDMVNYAVGTSRADVAAGSKVKAPVALLLLITTLLLPLLLIIIITIIIILIVIITS